MSIIMMMMVLIAILVKVNHISMPDDNDDGSE